MDNKMELWDVASGTERKLADIDGLGLNHGFFSPESDCVLSSDQMSLTVWDVSSGRLLWTTNASEPTRFSVDFTRIPGLLVANPTDPDRFEILETRTGRVRGILPNTALLPIQGRHVTLYNNLSPQPNAMEKLLGNWWPFKAKPLITQVRVIDLTTGAELTCVESDTLDGCWLSANGKTLVTNHHEDSQFLLRCWDVPMASRRALAIGVPVALGTVFVGLSVWWRSRKRRPQAVARHQTKEMT
jgi:hypothetical protein